MAAAIYKPNNHRSRDLSDKDMLKLIGFFNLLKEINDNNKEREINAGEEQSRAVKEAVY